MFYRINKNGNAVIFNADGHVVTRIDENVYPVGSELSARYEHPEGIILTVEDAKQIGIPEENEGVYFRLADALSEPVEAIDYEILRSSDNGAILYKVFLRSCEEYRYIIEGETGEMLGPFEVDDEEAVAVWTGKSYTVNYGTGAGNEYGIMNLDTAKAIADKGASYTGASIKIEDVDGNEVCRRPWWGVAYDSKTCEEEDPILFGDFGYYGDWQ